MSLFSALTLASISLAFLTESPPNLDEPRVKIMPGFPRDGDLLKPIARILPPLTVISPLLAYGYFIDSSKGIEIGHIIGFVFILLAHILMRFVQAHCGRYYTFDRSIKREHNLIMTGPYKYCQNPGYVAMMMTVTGVAIYSELSYVNIFPIFIICCVLSGVPIEEKMLREEFGQEYENFFNTRKRFIPGVF